MQAVTPLFDLLAILAVLATAVTIGRLAYLLLRGRRQQAGRTLTRWALGAAAYVAVALAIALARPERSIEPGQRWCFDDWCVSVQHVARRPAPPNAIYTLDLESSNA